MRVFLYESVCAGDLGSDVPASLLREGRAMLASLGADLRRVPGVEVVTMPHRGPGFIDSEQGRNQFFECSALSDATILIAPECDHRLHDLSQMVLEAGGRLLGSSPDAICLTADKLALAEFWREREVLHPRTMLYDDAVSVSFSEPHVLKPRHGAGSQATFLVRHRIDEMKTWAPAYHECPDDDFIIQPYVPGQAASVALLIGATQTIPLLPARQQLSRDGRFRYEGGSLPLPEPLARRAINLARQAVADIAGLRGYVGVDLILGDDGDYAIEINPRLTTSYLGLRQSCQQNLAALILRCGQGEWIETPTWEDREVHFRPDGLTVDR